MKDYIKQNWDGINLTKQDKVECLKQAKAGLCNAPAGLPVEVWRTVTHYLKSEKLARVAHIEGGDCEAISLTDKGVSLLWQIEREEQSKTDNPKPKKKSIAETKLESDELMAIKEKLIENNLITNGEWKATPAEFGCLVLELYEKHNIQTNGGHAWAAVAKWVGYKGSIQSARNAIQANPNTRGNIADLIREICKK